MARISIEVGHGGRDCGAIGVNCVYEKDVNLMVALELARQLERHGQAILLSRKTDVDDKAEAFYTKAKAWKPDLHLSIHANAFDGKAKGFEVYKSSVAAHKERSAVLCRAIESEVKALGQSSRGVKEKGFIMCAMPCPVAYCELGFIDCDEDFRQFDTEDKQRKFATAYAKGVLKYLGVEWVNETNSEDRLYRVQVGAFKNKTNATNYVKKLKCDGYDCFVKQCGDFYRVQVGAFKSKANAEKFLAVVRKDGYVDSFVTEG